jgi:carbonic anhydrase
MRGSILSTALLSLLPASVMASCGYGLDFVAPRTINVTVPNFDYGTTTGPENWHHIQASYGTCANGTHVSLSVDSTLLSALSSLPSSRVFEAPPIEYPC